MTTTDNKKELMQELQKIFGQWRQQMAALSKDLQLIEAEVSRQIKTGEKSESLKHLKFQALNARKQLRSWNRLLKV